MTITIDVVKGDITRAGVDVIVNAANSRMRGGGGVDGAIHRAAGPRLLEELEERCPDYKLPVPVSDVVWTHAHDLPAKYVFHVVGPDYRDPAQREEFMLANCYRNAIDLADAGGLQFMAFPLISSGIFAWPKEDAARIAVDTIREASKWARFVEQVSIVCFDDADYDLVRRTVEDHVTVFEPSMTFRGGWQAHQVETLAFEEDM